MYTKNFKITLMTPMKQALENFFKLKDNKTTIKNEILAGFTTFVTMAYIIFVLSLIHI